MTWRSLSILLFFFLTYTLHSQSGENPLTQVVSPIQVGTTTDHIQHLTSVYGIIISFDTRHLSDERIINIDNKNVSISDYLDDILKFQEVNYTSLTEGRIVIFPSDQRKKIDFHGYIKDASSHEVIAGAYVTDRLSGTTVYSNDEGFFSLGLMPGPVEIEAKYLGYKPLFMSLKVHEEYQYDIELEFDNNIPQILIEGDNLYGSKGGGETDVTAQVNNSSNSIFGENDMFTKMKMLSGVAAPDDGQGGFLVRGGSVVQNLIVYEGVPMYEVNHIGGFSSVFLDDAISTAQFYKGGFPARYGGRLSSVLNVKMDDGDPYEGEIGLSAGLLGGRLHVKGPIIKNKLTYNLSGRKSWSSLFLDGLLNDLLDNDATSLGFDDINLKLSLKPTKTTNISLAGYRGNDKFRFVRIQSFDEEGRNFDIDERNNLFWKNEFLSLNADHILGSFFFLHLNASALNYKYQSNGSYRYALTENGETVLADLFVSSFSGIKDRQVNSRIDAYISPELKLSMGGGYTHHMYNPTVQQQKEFVEDVELDFIEGDSLIEADEIVLFSELTLRPRSNWDIFLGLRLNQYSVENSQYRNIEPRLAIHYYPAKGHKLFSSFSRMTQPVHLLVNPGIGLPSDLWVPSTDEIRPEVSDQIEVGYNFYYSDMLKLGLSLYTKSQKNLIEYKAGTDLYANLQDPARPLTFNTSDAWESEVEVGAGNSRGMEFSYQFSHRGLVLIGSYTYSKTSRIFSEINEGEAYPYKYDRTHIFNQSFLMTLSDHWSLSGIWSISTGSAFTLATEEFKSIDDIKLLNTQGRNNFRLPNYHHLDLGVNYSSKGKVNWLVDLGVYNVYNRFNPSYVYLVDNPISKQQELKAVSTLPLLPYLRIKMTI